MMHMARRMVREMPERPMMNDTPRGEAQHPGQGQKLKRNLHTVVMRNPSLSADPITCIGLAIRPLKADSVGTKAAAVLAAHVAGLWA